MNNPANERYQHITRLWPRVMSGQVMTLDEYLAEPEQEQIYFYNWIKTQVGQFADLI